MAVPADGNIIQKEAERKLNTRVAFGDTRNVEHEMHDYILIIITRIIIGATGIVTEVLEKNLEGMSGKHSVDSLKRDKYAWNITHHKVLQSET